MKTVTFEDVKNSEEIKTCIRQADASLLALGYTEHAFAHVMRCADLASRWLLQLGYSEREAELARIAGYMHDIGNLVNRADHAQSGAIIAYDILTRMGMPVGDVAAVVTAIGNHDEPTACPVNSIAAALILADKTDVRRSRVRNNETIRFDIHDRVNYAVEKATTSLDVEKRVLTLSLEVDTEICAVMDYFEIFLERMLLCRRAAEFFKLHFQLVINGSALM
ncbi:MAG: HD domain-containing protein [Oscillospiraceae bacterium]